MNPRETGRATLFSLCAHGHPASGEKIVVQGLGEIGYTFCLRRAASLTNRSMFVQRIAPQLAAFSAKKQPQTGLFSYGVGPWHTTLNW